MRIYAYSPGHRKKAMTGFVSQSQGDGVDQQLDQVLESVSGYFALLAEPTRLRILHAICDQEKTVSDIVRETGASQTNVSRHLNAMHKAGVLLRRREANFTWYAVADRTVTDICRMVCIHIASRDDDQNVARLLQFAEHLGPAERASHHTPTRRSPDKDPYGVRNEP
jgi:DNA-binding transcriptional ArsR family regulator